MSVIVLCTKPIPNSIEAGYFAMSTETKCEFYKQISSKTFQ